MIFQTLTTSFKEQMLKGEHDLLTDTLKLALYWNGTLMMSATGFCSFLASWVASLSWAVAAPAASSSGNMMAGRLRRGMEISGVQCAAEGRRGG